MKKSVITNLIIVITTIIAVALYFTGGRDSLGATGVSCLKYFTTLSNILLAISALIFVIYELKGTIPQWVQLLKFSGTVAATITFLTVCLFLAPMAAMKAGPKVIWKFFEGNVFFLHFSGPVLGLLTFIFFEKGAINKKWTFVGTIPTTIYSFVYLTMVVILKNWNDWYGFTFGGRNYLSPVVILCMFGFAYAVSAGVLRSRI